MVFGLPAGMPMSALTVTHWPAASCIWRYGQRQAVRASCEAARKVLPSGQSTQPLRSRTASRGGFAEIELEGVERRQCRAGCGGRRPG